MHRNWHSLIASRAATNANVASRTRVLGIPKAGTGPLRAFTTSPTSLDASLAGSPQSPNVWTPECGVALDEFLTKKPSSLMQQTHGGKAAVESLSVIRTRPTADTSRHESAKEEAAEMLREAEAKVQAIRDDESLPKRAVKKKGILGKKQLKQAVWDDAHEKLKEIAVRHGYVSGQGVVFLKQEKADGVWFSVAHSVVSGALSTTNVYGANMVVGPDHETRAWGSTSLRLSMSNVFDRDEVTELMRTLMRQHGVKLTLVKFDLHKAMGLDKGKIKSHVWLHSNLLSNDDFKKLRKEYYGEFHSKSTE
ncbi:hypothetical protein WOLCODRAFT_145875 [Wolfiporia cocos MD-104 SS10]|uniref:DUF1917-domain-containing protein n=1 Tax=Wolfiporia cocos (strain MD-104) TaxID=742152 RepID=A0A2H3J1P5_WOLCO|nr:hypothetical protein WOLCODRAFT_145875 [Wolfiporia cocos MD-104 SS10]